MSDVVNDYTALLSGSYWNGIEVTGKPVIVTFAFPTSLPSYDASIPGFTTATDTSFTAFTSAGQTEALSARGEWSAASGLVFIQVAPGQGEMAYRLDPEVPQRLTALPDRLPSPEPVRSGWKRAAGW